MLLINKFILLYIHFVNLYHVLCVLEVNNSLFHVVIEKTELPCHLVGQKVFFHSGSSTAAFIHQRTDKFTVDVWLNPNI